MNFLNVQTIKYLAVCGLFLAAAAFSVLAEAATRDEFVAPNASKFYTYHADEDETFRVVIRGDGDTDVDLIVRGPSGNRMCQSLGSSDRERCVVTSPNGGKYRIEVRNLGDVSNLVNLRLD